MRAIAFLCRGTFVLFFILCLCAWGGLATSALAEQDYPAYGSVVLIHSDDHLALNTSVSSITVKGYDQNGKVVCARSGLEPAAILTIDEVPLNCVALGIFYFDATNPSPIHMAEVGLKRDGSGLMFITDPDLGAMSSCTTTAWIDPPEMEHLPLTDSNQDLSDDVKELKQPTVAISKNYVVIVWTHLRIHQEYQYQARVGKLGYAEDGSRQITWGEDRTFWTPGYYGCSAPNASLNDDGWLVVVGNIGDGLYVSSLVCKVKDDLTLGCGHAQRGIALGKRPSVSINDKGAGVVMYESDIFDTLWYRLVYIDEDDKKLSVKGEYQHDRGYSSRVAINANGGVVEVHESANLFRPNDLWLNVGVIDFGKNTIKWGRSQRFETDGSAPVAALTDDGAMMAAYYVPGSSPNRYKAYYLFGLVDFDKKVVTWQGGHHLRDQSFWPALSANRQGEVAAFVYDAVTGYRFFGLGELRQQPVCPWPSVFTHAPYYLYNLEAKSGGNVVSQGYAPVTQRGVCWSSSPNPTIEDDHTTDGKGLGRFSSLLNGLDSGTQYYIRAYAKNKNGVGYGQETTFQTMR